MTKNPDLELPWYQEIIFAYLLDICVGDPKNFPHPVRWIGQMAGWLEKATRRYMANPFIAGCTTTILMLFVTVAGAWGLLWFLGMVHPYLETCGSIYLLYVSLSARSLYDESKPVADCLYEGLIDKARIALSQIVGRDTGSLNASGVTRATVETIAENTIDGVVAPLLYACLGGAPLAIGYKCINTLDSLFGYRNETYERFGKFPARLDDVANWIPARIGGVLMILASCFCGYRGLNAWRIMWRDGGKHLSPNAGIPEAAMAGALGLQLGGASNYGGIPVEKPFIGDSLKEVETVDISRSHRVMFSTSLLSLFFFVWLFWELGVR